MDELNKRIVDLMIKTGHSKSTFAIALGVSLPLITHVTSGRNKPGVEILQKIVVQFSNINPTWLLTGQGNMETEPIKNIDIEEITNTLNLLSHKINTVATTHQTVLQYHKMLLDEVLHLHEMSGIIANASNELHEMKTKLQDAANLLTQQ